ncbi:MAG: helix-turn-helix domain-containing protein [Ferrimicrobium sp.]
MADEQWMSPRLISIGEAAWRIGISRSTAYRAIVAGTLPLRVIMVGGRRKVSSVEVERLLRGEAPYPDPGVTPSAS